ncbi:MAG TPA: hypothetical protein VN043_04805 [Rhodanobacter sp.]|nr:hypothetical protein [Rhodanobacter sp.]
MDNPYKPWFSRKKSGWGVGPSSWQGWLVMAVYAAIVFLLGREFPPAAHRVGFYAGIIVVTGLLLAVIVLKGMPRKGG